MIVREASMQRAAGVTEIMPAVSREFCRCRETDSVAGWCLEASVSPRARSGYCRYGPHAFELDKGHCTT